MSIDLSPQHAVTTSTTHTMDTTKRTQCAEFDSTFLSVAVLRDRLISRISHACTLIESILSHSLYLRLQMHWKKCRRRWFSHFNNIVVIVTRWMLHEMWKNTITVPSWPFVCTYDEKRVNLFFVTFFYAQRSFAYNVNWMSTQFVLLFEQLKWVLRNA